MLEPKTYHVRRGNTCLSQRHIIFWTSSQATVKCAQNQMNSMHYWLANKGLTRFVRTNVNWVKVTNCVSEFDLRSFIEKK